MHSTTTTAARQTHQSDQHQPATFTALAGKLAEQGFRTGPPTHITPATQAIDAAMVRRLKCRCCGKGGGMLPTTYHNANRYKMLARCSWCGAGEEV